MCGIAGVVYAEPGLTPDPTVLGRMDGAIAHRGPDGHGTFAAPGVGLVHRRLAIIDPAGAAQPLASEDGSVQITFNGEIYNYREQRTRLEARGHRFRTRSDTEVLVHLYEDLGERMVGQLRGMFAFAIWDVPRRRLFLARDRVGLKPLYFCRNDREFWFASEPRAIIAGRGCTADVDPRSLDDYLAFGMTLGPKSFYLGIEQLPPAHTLTIDPGRWHAPPRRYWELLFDPDPDPTVDWVGRIRETLDDAVRAHLVADVPVGALLSGGVDSSAVTASAALRSESPVMTFSVGFHEKEFCEIQHARLTAGLYETDHHEEILTPAALSWLDVQTRAYDEPLADPSTLPTLVASRLASRWVKVVLSGDGGDEAFGGYPRYAHDFREDRLRRHLPGWLRRRVLGPLGAIWPRGEGWPRALRLKTALTNLSLDAGPAYANTMQQCRQPLRRRLLSPSVTQALRTGTTRCAMTAAYDASNSGSALSRMMHADLSVTMPDDYLVKIDRASMYYGLEVRPPLLDHLLLEFAAQIPPCWNVRPGATKWAFRKAQEGRLPREILTRPKQGFLIPVDRWLRAEMPLARHFADTVLRANAPVHRFVDPKVVRQLYDGHTRCRSQNGRILWTVLVLSEWADHYLNPPAGRRRDGAVSGPGAGGGTG